METPQPVTPSYPAEGSTNDLAMEDLAALTGLFNPCLLTDELGFFSGLGE